MKIFNIVNLMTYSIQIQMYFTVKEVYMKQLSSCLFRYQQRHPFLGYTFCEMGDIDGYICRELMHLKWSKE